MQRKIIPVSSQIVITVLFVLLFSVLFSLANLIHNNYQYELKRKEFESENQRYEDQNKSKMYEYLRSNLRKVLEKERKETLNQINPGEQVIVLHTENENTIFEGSNQNEKAPEVAHMYEGLPNIVKWQHFFFDPYTQKETL